MTKISKQPCDWTGDFLFSVSNNTLPAFLSYVMTITYLYSPVTGQGDFLFSVSNNTLPAFLSYVIFDDYKISKQPCDWTRGFSIPSK